MARKMAQKESWSLASSLLQCKGTVVPASIVRDIAAWFSSGFLWLMADRQVLQGLHFIPGSHRTPQTILSDVVDCRNG